MLFFGERAAETSPRALLVEVERAFARARAAAPGPARHDALTRALLGAAGVAQGLADAERSEEGLDADGPLARAGLALALAAGRALWRSFLSGGTFRPRAPATALARLRGAALPEAVRVKEPEGHAHLSAGAWRARVLGPDARGWPPSQGWLERRKWLLRAGGRRWLVRFAGLGEPGEARWARAQALAAAGLGPAPAALARGLLFLPWREGAPAPVARPRRADLLAAAHAHLAFVATAFPAGADARRCSTGAAPAALLAMAAANAGEALGAEAERAARRLERALPTLETTARPVEVDGRPGSFEWLVLADGRIEKVDALDHHRGHDLAGAQDALWDVAGAALELGLSRREAERLAERVRVAAPGADPRHLGLYRVAYAALAWARWATLVAAGGADAAEAARRVREAGRWRRRLARELGCVRAGTGLARTARRDPAYPPTSARSSVAKSSGTGASKAIGAPVAGCASSSRRACSMTRGTSRPPARRGPP